VKLISNQMAISDLSLAENLPTMYGVRVADGLMSYAPSYPDLFRRAAEYVDKILRGIKTGGHPNRATDKV
jgi:putative ABC transport system substrate-binding protein